MCGIVGLFLKDASLEPACGRMLAGMLEEMTSRGPDSAGFAVYGAQETAAAGQAGPARLKSTLRAESASQAGALAEAIVQRPGCGAVVRDTHVVASLDEGDEQAFQEFVAQRFSVERVGVGRRMELYKEVGLPADITARFALREMPGSHGIGHTRMATESAVTTDGAHPFSTGHDQCLVHNGSLSNHNRLRLRLRRRGLDIRTLNDSEVGAAYISWCMSEGMSLEEALNRCLEELDGFYTFVVGTENGFGVLRDPIACKPAVMAETDAYVAFGSEFRALADLPGVEQARLFEPEPAKVYFWERH